MATLLLRWFIVISLIPCCMAWNLSSHSESMMHVLCRRGDAELRGRMITRVNAFVFLYIVPKWGKVMPLKQASSHDIIDRPLGPNAPTVPQHPPPCVAVRRRASI